MGRRVNEKKRKRERKRGRESDRGMILFGKRKWMTEGLNSIPDTYAVVGKTVPRDG